MIRHTKYSAVVTRCIGLSLFCFLYVCLSAQKNIKKPDGIQQKDVVEIINNNLHINTNKVFGRVRKRKIYYSFLPTGTSVPGGGTALVTSTTAAFYLGDRKNTSISTITFSPYITFKGRFGYSFRSNLWSKNNDWDVMGDTRFLYYPQYTWGLGGNTSDNKKLLVNYKYVRFYQTFLRKIRPCFLVGFGYHFDYHFDVETVNDSFSLEKFTAYHYGTSPTEKSLSTGFSLNLLYDARRNSINPIPGFYGNLVYRFNPAFSGSNKNWHSLYADMRKYISFSGSQQNMLALWAFYWTALNKHVPYLDLPSIGWDPYQQRSGRGFNQNRYRGRGLLYFESEYRRNITSDGLFGFVLFANMNSVAQPNTQKYSYLNGAVGGGIRIKFNKRSGTNVALDYGISKSYSNFSLNLGESF